MTEVSNNEKMNMSELVIKDGETNEEYLERIKNIKFSDMNLLRGETPEDIQHKAHKLCGEYLGGAWLEIKQDNIVINRISGGLTNQLYYCALPEDVKTLFDEPREIALRLYGSKHMGTWDENNERFSDTIVSVIMSNKGLGPKIYGVFPQGEIQKFYKVNHLRFVINSFNYMEFR